MGGWCCNSEAYSLLVLPTGEILIGDFAVYRGTGSPQPHWAPVITRVPTIVTPGGTYQIFGRQFSGFSVANAFGDENQSNTNYPLVRITNVATGHVIYRLRSAPQ